MAAGGAGPSAAQRTPSGAATGPRHALGLHLHRRLPAPPLVHLQRLTTPGPATTPRTWRPGLLTPATSAAAHDLVKPLTPLAQLRPPGGHSPPLFPSFARRRARSQAQSRHVRALSTLPGLTRDHRGRLKRAHSAVNHPRARCNRYSRLWKLSTLQNFELAWRRPPDGQKSRRVEIEQQLPTIVGADVSGHIPPHQRHGRLGRGLWRLLHQKNDIGGRQEGLDPFGPSHVCVSSAIWTLNSEDLSYPEIIRPTLGFELRYEPLPLLLVVVGMSPRRLRLPVRILVKRTGRDSRRSGERPRDPIRFFSAASKHPDRMPDLRHPRLSHSPLTGDSSSIPTERRGLRCI